MLNSKNTYALKTALLAGAAMVAYSGLAANAQDTDPDKVEKVTVTGTRIKQRDFTSISPLATVGAKDLEMTGTVNTEELLNTLPQIIPGVTISSNNPSLNGFATADLRGLGPGRTLILINGRRANPSSSGGAVDLNTIPVNLIERIEVVSGGASAVYGADAVAGAINFILKDNYEGINIGGSYGQAEDGVAPYWTADALIGGKFDGDRGSIQLGLSYYNRSEVLASEREWSRYSAAVLRRAGIPFVSFSAADLTVPGTTVVANGGSATSPWSNSTNNGVAFSIANIYTASGIPANSLDGNCNPTDGIQNPSANTIRFRTGGGIAPFQSCPHPNFVADGSLLSDGDRYNFAPDNNLILGNERVSAATFAKYDILPDGVLTAFLDAQFTNTRSSQQLAATPIGNGTAPITVQYDLNPNAGPGQTVVNPYVLAQPQLLHLAQLTFPGCVGPFPNPASVDCLDNRTFNVNVRTTQVGNRTADYETNALGTTQGLRGTIPTLDWDWEVFHSFARNTTTVFQNNNVSRTAMQQLYNSCNTTSNAAQPRPLNALPNCPFPTSTSAGPAPFVPTATTNNPLGMFSLSQDMINFVRIDATDVITYERTMIGGNASGDIADLWGEGAISAAVGFEYRMESLDTRVDPSKGSGDIIGFNAAENIAGEFDVYELYGEVEVPLITGETLFENLSLVGGYRKSDYSTGAGLTETWKYGAEWSPFSWLTFRAIENHAVRAPTAFELFQNGDQNFPAYTDPCNGPVPAAPATVASCTAWFGNFGAVWAAGFIQPNNQVQAFQIGNPNLQPEVADTLTYGVVFNPDWWPVGRLGLSVDRYEIELDNRIALLGIGGPTGILTRCTNAIIANANVYPVGNVFCDLVVRANTGGVSSINQSRLNVPGVTLFSGVDVNARWSWDMEEDIGLPGTLGIATLYTWVDAAGGNEGFYVGSIGGVVPEDKAATSISYDLEDWGFLLRWNYVGEVNGLNAGEEIASYNLYDFGARWDMTDDLQMTFGVDNIFDEQPPIFPSAVNAGGQFNTDTSTYDVLGRQYRMGLRWKH